MRLIVADDSLLLREGISRLLTEAGFQVVGLASTGEEALAQVEQHKPDVAIVDIRMPPTTAMRGSRRPRRSGPAIPTSACWCCRSTWSWVWPPDSSPRTPPDWDTY